MMHHHPRDLRALKTGLGLLIRDVGGLEAAASVTGYSHGRLSEAASVHNEARWPRVDHVAELEAVAGQPRVTFHLARLPGCTLLPMPVAHGDCGMAIGAVLRTAGEFGGRAAEAMADGRLDDAERAALVERLAALKRAVAHAEAVIAGPALKLKAVS
jgi:hypothetical protein